jgi:hypothetical protein
MYTIVRYMDIQSVYYDEERGCCMVKPVYIQKLIGQFKTIYDAITFATKYAEKRSRNSSLDLHIFEDRTVTYYDIEPCYIGKGIVLHLYTNTYTRKLKKFIYG